MSQSTTPSSVMQPEAQGLYSPLNEHDACGVGFIANIKGKKSHDLVAQGLKILDNLSHRGATGYDPLLGDGAGILIQLPDLHLRRACGKQGMTLPAIGHYGVGMVFLPQEAASRMACEQEIERAIQAEGQILLGWRDVPTNNHGLSAATILVEPIIRQVFVARGASEMSQDDLERKLYIIRKRSGHAIQALNLRHGNVLPPKVSSRQSFSARVPCPPRISARSSDRRGFPTGRETLAKSILLQPEKRGIVRNAEHKFQPALRIDGGLSFGHGKQRIVCQVRGFLQSERDGELTGRRVARHESGIRVHGLDLIRGKEAGLVGIGEEQADKGRLTHLPVESES